MSRKTLAAAVIVPLLLSVSAADAAPKKKRKPAPPKPVCNLITDPAGDATGTGTQVAGPNDPNMDILSADVATNATTLTVVVRLSTLGSDGDTSPLGRAWGFTFTTAGEQVDLRSITGPGGNSWANGLGTGTLDVAGKQVRFSVPLSKLSVPIKPKQPLTALQVRTSRWVAGTNVVLGLVDSATSTKVYLAGHPSCVKVGA